MRNRAGGLLIENGKVLLMHRIKDFDGKIYEYYVVPGGGALEGESLIQATVREMKEEIGIEVEVINSTPIYKYNMENGTQYFMLVKQIGGKIGTGKGPEFTDLAYANRGTYNAELIDLNDIIDGKINMVPEDIENMFIKDILKFENISTISSSDLVKNKG